MNNIYTWVSVVEEATCFSSILLYYADTFNIYYNIYNTKQIFLNYHIPIQFIKNYII